MSGQRPVVRDVSARGGIDANERNGENWTCIAAPDGRSMLQGKSFRGSARDGIGERVSSGQSGRCLVISFRRVSRLTLGPHARALQRGSIRFSACP
jgi:hypothetical protein